MRHTPALPRDWAKFGGGVPLAPRPSPAPLKPPQDVPEPLVEVPAPVAAEVVLPPPDCALTALKRHSHRAQGELPKAWDGGNWWA